MMTEIWMCMECVYVLYLCVMGIIGSEIETRRSVSILFLVRIYIYIYTYILRERKR